MRSLVGAMTIGILFAYADPAAAQSQPRHVDLEVEPVAYILGGAGGHVGVQAGHWTYTIEAYHLEVPESLHGNHAFDVSPLGVELHAERSFGTDRGGFYAGPEIGIRRLELVHRSSGVAETHTRYSVGMRAGYRWYTGFGNLYLSPVLGLGYTLNAAPVTIAGDTFESGFLRPWGTVGIGWSFRR